MLKIVVAVKFYRGDIGPFDEAALECALSVPDAEVTVIAMAPGSVKQKLEFYTRLGAERAILISDPAYAGSDTLATAKVLARAVKMLRPDLVLCGRQSLNGDTAQVPPQLAVFAGYGFIPYVMKFGVDTAKTRLGNIKVSLPVVMSVERIATLRMPRIGSRVKNAEIWDNAVLQLDKEDCGTAGAKTHVLRVYEKQENRRNCAFIAAGSLHDAIINAMQKKQVIVEENTGKSEKLENICVYGEGAVSEAKKLGENIIAPKEQTPRAMADEIRRLGVRAVLFEANLKYRSVAPQVAAYLNEGLAADCIGFRVNGGRISMYRPASAESTVAEVVCTGDIQLATVRCKTQGAGLVFGIGWGARGHAKQITALAEKYGAEVVSSRRVADADILPYETQVGLTGKIIAPRVYVAFGISGAVQHIVGIERAGTVIAVNKDKNAKIFDYADYGITEDINNVGL